MNIIFILALLSGVVADDFEVPPDMVFGTSTVHGTLIGFEGGTHIQPVITDRNGEMVSFWSSGPLMNYFLSIHVMERVTLEIEEVDTFIVSIGEVARILRIIEATAESTSFTVWRDSLEAEGEPEELLGDYYSAPLEHLIQISNDGEEPRGS